MLIINLGTSTNSHPLHEKNAKRTNLVGCLQEKQAIGIGIHVISIITLPQNLIRRGKKYPLTFSYKQKI